MTTASHPSTHQNPECKSAASSASSPASPSSLRSTRPYPPMNQCTDEAMNQSPKPTPSYSAFFRFPVSSFMSPAPCRLVVGYVPFGSRLVVGWWSVTCRLVVDWWSVMCRFSPATLGLNPCQSSLPSQNPMRNSITTTKNRPNPTTIPSLPPIGIIPATAQQPPSYRAAAWKKHIGTFIIEADNGTFIKSA